jgi:hypothetical protein
MTVYLALLPGLIFLPFLNFYTNLPGMAPVILSALLLRIRSRSGQMAYVA